MRLVLAISTVLGVIGVAAAFLLFYLGERVFHMDRLTVQTLMYLKLSVAGHLTIFLTRTRGPFWSIRPAKILLIAVVGTQTIATLIAVYGLFMTPLGWKWAGFVWAYAIAWALINDRIKLLAYKIFDPVKAEPKAETKSEPKPEAKADAPKPEAKANESKTEVKTDAPKPEAKADEPKPEAKTDAPKPEAKADEPKPDAKADEPKPAAKDKTQPEVSPQLVKRVHELYEQLGREDVQAVLDWEKAEPEDKKTASDK
jgi:H+-transporting ATPase